MTHSHTSFSQILTLNACRGVVVALWVLPFLGIAAPFCLIPGQGGNSIEQNWLEFWLKKPLEVWLEVPYTNKRAQTLVQATG